MIDLKFFHPEVLPHTTKILHNILLIYEGIYVRATCFDLVGHPQALQIW